MSFYRIQIDFDLLKNGIWIDFKNFYKDYWNSSGTLVPLLKAVYILYRWLGFNWASDRSTFYFKRLVNYVSSVFTFISATN